MKKAAFYYPWYDTGRHWSEGYISRPKVGLYSSINRKLIQEQISQLKKANISTLVCSWWGIGSFEDKSLLSFVLPELVQNKIEFYILYEQFHSRTVNELSVDIKYLNDNYFTFSNYSKVDGSPSLFLYLSRINNSDEINLKTSAINSISKVNTIGDEVYWYQPNHEQLSRFRLFNELSIYNPHVSNPSILKTFWKKVFNLYCNWQDFCCKNNISFTPTIIPGFNDTAVRPEEKHPVIERDASQFVTIIKNLKKRQFSQVNICSFNEWHENTQIEPSEDDDFITLLAKHN